MNASQSARNTIVNWVMPDYANGIGLSGFLYTAPSDGFVTGHPVGGVSGIVYVNGSRVGVGSNSNADATVQLFVSKNDVITVKSGYTFGYCNASYFYPLKGGG